MKKINLLLTFMMSCLISFGATISGTVMNTSNQPVANLTVYLVDSNFNSPANGYSATTLTNSSGVYSFTIPSNVPSGDWMEIYTNTCGMMYTNMYQYTGANGTSNFTVCGISNPLYDTTGGFVSFISPAPSNAFTPAYPAVVYLIEKTVDSMNNSFILTMIDSTNTDSNGMYQFVYLAGSNPPYLIKAALDPANPYYANVLPTYYDSSLTWDLALYANGQNNDNIYMVTGNNPGGPGFIGGSVLQGANKTTNVGDPLNKRIIFLTNMSNHAIAYTYSDAAGNFSFSNLAYGSYKLFGDALGKTHPTLIVTISATQQSVSNVVFEENNKTFKGHIGTNAINDVAIKDIISVYPNPVKDQLNISHLDQIDGTKTIRLMSMTGSLLFHQTTEKAALTIPTNQLPTGIYSLIINSEAGTAVYSISK